MTQAELMPLPHKPPPFGDVVKGAEISDDGLFRWTLTRCWAAGPYVCWIMLNPSKADHLVDDPTILRCMGFSRRWGYGGLKVVNVWPYRTSSPAELRRWIRATDGIELARISGENIRVVETVAVEAGLVMAAWGAAAGEDGDDLAACLEYEGVELNCLGVTNNGHPTHPLARGKHRVPDDALPQTWKAPEVYA